MASGEQDTGVGRGRNRLFAVIAVMLGLAAGFGALEAGLGWLHASVERSHRLDPGMIGYDAELGWRLARDWRGRHRHHDFDATYTTNRFGFRGDFAGALAPDRTRRIGVLGDSFTFGLGVNDGETLVDRLGQRAPRQVAVLNLSVPGFSTDQEALLARRLLTVTFRPTELVLVAYLANDLVDNELAYPVQAAQAKPYFRLGPQGLSLHNVPVPQAPKPPGAPRTLAQVLLAGTPAPGPLERVIGGLEVVRRLGIQWPSPPRLFPGAEERFRPSIELFVALVTRLHETAARFRMKLTVVLLPGRSLFAAPGSVSAQYQEHIRREIVRRADALAAPVIDIAAALRRQSGGAAAAAQLYFPNDGHLTPAGHRAVAAILADHLF